MEKRKLIIRKILGLTLVVLWLQSGAGVAAEPEPFY